MINEQRLKTIVRQVISEALDTKPKKGDFFRVPQGLNPMTMAKMLAKKYGINHEDFNYTGSTLIYNPKVRASKKRSKISKPEGMPVDEYYRKMVLPNKPELQDEEDKYPDEEWRPVQNIGRYFKGAADFTNAYEVSNYGRLKIINLDDAVKSRIYMGYDAPTRGSMQAHLNTTDINGNKLQTTGFIGNIVADVFLEPKDPKKFMIRHKDGNYGNNRADNLEWVPRVRGRKA